MTMIERIDFILKEGIGKKFRHFKGGVYVIIGFSKHTETGEILVNYTKVNSKDNMMFSRPLDMFADVVDKNKYPNVEQYYRLEHIGECDMKLVLKRLYGIWL